MKTENIDNLTRLLNTANSYLEGMAKSLHNLSSDHWVMVSALASVLVGVVALCAAYKDFIYGWIFKPRIKIDGNAFTLQQKNFLISRLPIKNKGKQAAKNVSFWVEKLEYYENENWNSKNNFLRFPLTWTHLSSAYRDLFFETPCDLDLCQIICDENMQPICINLCTAYGLLGLSHGLDDLEAGKNRIQMTLYCENHKIKHYCIEIGWDGTLNYPEIEIREE